MTNKPAAIPFFGDAYLADTTHLTTEEHGAYFLLLLAAWRQSDCALPMNDNKLARIAGLTPRKWKSIKPTIMEFWKVEDARIYQPRLRKERDYVCQKSEQNRKAAATRWKSQDPENTGEGGMQTQSKRNAPPPPPPPIEEPNGSSPPVVPQDDADASKKKRKPVLETKDGVLMPEGWEPSYGPKTAEMVNGWPDGMLDRELRKFKNHAADKGRRSKDWNAALRTWLENADEWRNENGRGQHAIAGDGFTRSLDAELGIGAG